jgi:hypothetical protein
MVSRKDFKTEGVDFAHYDFIFSVIEIIQMTLASKKFDLPYFACSVFMKPKTSKE